MRHKMVIDLDGLPLARRLKVWRAASGCTQKQLAHLARVSRSQIAKVETGRVARTPKARARLRSAIERVLAQETAQ